MRLMRKGACIEDSSDGGLGLPSFHPDDGEKIARLCSDVNQQEE